MKRKNQEPKDVATYYEKRWNAFKTWWKTDETYCIHYGFYDEKCKDLISAILNMNNYVGRLLGLEKGKKQHILDAGCGVGGTSAYLARKYPDIKFTGITITPSQVKIAKEYLKKNNISNVEIIHGDFTKTQFTDNTFDSIFAIESVGYTENIKDFIDEMYRILKSGGKLIVLDGFRTKEEMDSLTKKIYETYLYGQGYQKLDLPHIKNYINLLKKKGFKNIIHKDISDNVVKTQIYGVAIGIPWLISYILKKIFTFGIIDSKKNYLDFSMGVSVLAPIIALKKISRYYMTVAIKKG